MSDEIHYLCARDEVLLVRRPYTSWEEIEKDFPGLVFVSWQGPLVSHEVVEVVEDCFRLSPSTRDYMEPTECPFSRQEMAAFLESGDEILRRPW